MNNLQDDSLPPGNRSDDTGLLPHRAKRSIWRRVTNCLIIFVALFPCLTLWAVPQKKLSRSHTKERILLASAFPTPTPGAFFPTPTPVPVEVSPTPTPRPTATPTPVPVAPTTPYRFTPHELTIRNSGDPWQGHKFARRETVQGQTVTFEVRLVRASRVYDPGNGGALTYVPLASTITGVTAKSGWVVRYFNGASDLTPQVTSSQGWRLPMPTYFNPTPYREEVLLRIEVTCVQPRAGSFYDSQEAVLSVSDSAGNDEKSHEDAASVTGSAFFQMRLMPVLYSDRDYWVRFWPRSEYASKMIGGYFQGSQDGSAWNNLATISSEPSSTEPTDLPLGATYYIYWRYLSPSGIDARCNIAELEFRHGAGFVSGTPFGSPSTSQDKTFLKAFDGSLTTHFNARSADGAYVGIAQFTNFFPSPAVWRVGPAISSKGIHHPSAATGLQLVRGTTGRLNAYTAVDWDDWEHDVVRQVLGLQRLVRETTKVADVCSYSWSATDGSFPEGSTGPDVLYKARDAAGFVTITLTVSDQNGANLAKGESGARSGSTDIPKQFSVQIQIIN